MNLRRLIFLRLFVLCLLDGVGTFAAEPITRIADIRSLSSEVAVTGLPVRVRGVVTWRNSPDEFVLQDDSGGSWVLIDDSRRSGIWKGDDAVRSQVHEGMEVEIDGVTHAAGFAPVIWPKTMRILGPKPLPPARPLDRTRFLGGAESGQRIEVRGVILGAQPMDGGWKLRMQAGPDTFLVMVTDKVVSDPNAILNADVLVRGIGASGYNLRREFLSARILVSVPEDFVVESLSALPASAVPLVSLGQFRAFRNEPEKPHRLRVQGTVTFVVPGTFFYLQDGDRTARIEPRSAVSLELGDRVEAVGFVDMGRNIAGLGGADVRKLGRGTLPEPEQITPEQIMTINVAAADAGRAAQPYDYDGHLIRFRAVLLAVQSAPNGEPLRRRLTLEQGNMTVETVLHQSAAASLDAIQPGSELEVTGVVQLEFVNVDAGRRRTMLKAERLVVLLGDATDVTVLRAPSWWTTARLAGMLALGVILLSASLFWGWQLRRQVARKTHQLAEEMRARRDAAVEFQATLRERNRLAANLHDTLLQTLGGLNYQLKACEAESLPQAERKANHLDTARRMVERGQSDLRGTVWALRVLPLHGQTMSDALRALAEQLGEGHNVEFSVKGEASLPAISEFVAGNLLLVAQEAMHNALKHARPSHVEVEVTAEGDGKRLVLVVRDDGIGFRASSQAGAAHGHFGLLGMQERAERLGGRISIDSAPGRGTTLRAEVPLQPFDDEIE
jgi:signal transduction histidine kinase